MLQGWRGFPLLAFITMTTVMIQAAAELDVEVTAARCRHPRAVQAPDGTIYVYGALKSNDGGRYFWPVDESDPPFGSYLFAEKLTSLYWRKGLFLGFYWNVTCREPGRCVGRMWRSRDGMKTVERKETVLIIPEAGSVPVDNFSEVEDQNSSTIFFHRGIREMPDGTLLACMIGSFEQDNMPTTDPRSKMETTFKMRSFLISSDDRGDTWRYFSTVAAPRAGVVDDTEGFNEWALLPLDDGRMLAVMRTGHYSPLVASWSDDGGRTWSPRRHGPGPRRGPLSAETGGWAIGISLRPVGAAQREEKSGLEPRRSEKEMPTGNQCRRHRKGLARHHGCRLFPENGLSHNLRSRAQRDSLPVG